MQMHRRTKFVGEVAKQRRSRPQGPARVSDDERGTVIVLILVEGLDRSGGISTHRDIGDVDVLVLHLHETEVLLSLNLTGSGELGDRAAYATLRLCRPAGSIVVGVAFKTSARNCNGPQSIMAAQAA
jgi:hypothetical protein